MRFKIITLVLAMGMLFTGCKNGIPEQNQGNIDNQEQTNQNESTEKENDKDNETNKENQTDGTNQNEEVKLETIYIYTADSDNTDKIIEYGQIEIDRSKSIKEKLELLATNLKEVYFKGNNIDIEIDSIDTNNIATINLIDENSWLPLFQGSTGAQITQNTIIETFLQREYTGEWIEGIKILVDDKSDIEYDHLSFVGTFER